MYLILNVWNSPVRFILLDCIHRIHYCFPIYVGPVIVADLTEYFRMRSMDTTARACGTMTFKLGKL